MVPSELRLITLLLLVLAAVFSCRPDGSARKTPEDPDREANDIAGTKNAPLPALPYLAVFDEQTEQLKAERNDDFDGHTVTADALTRALVANYPQITPEVEQISNDTIYIRIADAHYLTQQMGSSGAEMYLMEATYAYTELPDVRVVHYSFAEGDHALPGNYTRSSF